MSDLRTKAQEDLYEAISRTNEVADALCKEYQDLQGMHSQLAQLNVERQRIIAALADMAENLFAISVPFQSERDTVWRAMVKEYREAMKLAGREPK